MTLKLVAVQTNLRAGKIEFIDGVQCYIATPPGDYSKEKVLLYLTDAFGIPLVNNRVGRGPISQASGLMMARAASG